MGLEACIVLDCYYIDCLFCFMLLTSDQRHVIKLEAFQKRKLRGAKKIRNGDEP